MKKILVIMPEEPSTLLFNMMTKVLGNEDFSIITSAKELKNLQNKKILFVLELNEIGTSNALNNIFLELYNTGKDSLLNSEGAVLIHSNYNILFTKTTAQSIIFLANNLGCSFIGRPLVEATAKLENFISMEKVYNMSLEEICLQQCKELGSRFLEDNTTNNEREKKLLVLHSSNREISNTLMLWDMVKSYLHEIEISEINVGNGNVLDCKGCPYKTCKYLGKQTRCFYGGIVVEEVYPAILRSNSILFICPNYNDMVTANLVATINRLTALYRQTKFYDKTIFSIIVSGYSGGDAIAKQLISSLNMNKTFKLPPYFSLMTTANDKGAIKEVPNIENLAKEFAYKINSLN
ncbi:NAD(P)H-dependent oxidoreductase [Tissierella carlieri]|uniref:NAD(P)H-dependent oxidoreductase n=1 Tax=Tissierella carlieri TaxID=689904 RepID=A0ABT1S8F4_9FIRM|nr:NAD(P)H-dependent oxidoreductase [Tissierella carlieri]MCQ4922744.1 NAD(P)H-dependent oxidoreductase [Tissierella carlieri]